MPAFPPNLIATMLERGAVTPAQVEECRRACPDPDDSEAVLEQLLRRGFVVADELRALGGTITGSPPTAAGEDPGTTRMRTVVDTSAQPTTGPPGASASEPTAVRRPAGEVRRFGPFEILAEIGRGGMGVVYRARDTRLGRIVAVKGILGAATGLSEPEAARFRTEARAAARLRHPGIVQVHEVGEIDGQAYLVMDFIDGADLRAHLRDHPEDPRWCARLVREAAEAVAHAHREGILHRDLKPENILVDRSGHAYVGDFGLARELDAGGTRLTASGTILGTPSYMAPEQAEGRPRDVGPRSDVYGLGAVLYHALTGTPPFAASSLPETLYRVVHTEPVPPSRRNPQVPRDLAVICLKCLEKDPDRRYAGAGDLADDLGRFLGGEAIRALPPSLPYRASRWVTRHRALSAALLALTVVGALGAWLATEARRSEQRRLRSVRESDFYRETEVQIVRALARCRLGDPSSLRTTTGNALERAEQLLREDPDSASAHFVRGWLLRLAGRPDLAEAALSETLRRKPDDPAARYERGLARAEKYADALESARRTWRLRRVGSGGAVGTPREPSLEDLAAVRSDLPALRDGSREDFEPLRTPADPGRAAELGGGTVECGLGWLAYHERDYDSATEQFRSALRAEPLRDEAWHGLTRCAKTRMLRAEATVSAVRTLYEEALRANAGDWLLRLSRAEVLSEVAENLRFYGASAEIDEMLRIAAADAEQVLGWEPGRPAPWLTRARIREQQAEIASDRREGEPIYRQAIADATEAIRVGGPDPEALSWRGRAWCYLGREQGERSVDPSASLRAAIEDFTAAVTADPLLADAFNRRGIACQFLGDWRARLGEDPQGDYRAALDDLEAALRANPDGANAYQATRATVLLAQGRAEWERGLDARPTLVAAVAELNAVLERAPGMKTAHLNRAAVRSLLGRVDSDRGRDPHESYRQALQDLDEALRQDPEMFEARVNRASTRYLLAQAELTAGRDPRPLLQEALADCDGALAQNARAMEARATRANSRLLLAHARRAAGEDPREDLRAALADYAEALRLDPENPELRYSLANARRHLGDEERRRGGSPTETYLAAQEEFSSILRRNSRFPAAYLGRGLVHASLARIQPPEAASAFLYCERALQDFDCALALHPVLWQAHLEKGRVLEALGCAHAALKEWEEVEAQLGAGAPALAAELRRGRAAASGEAPLLLHPTVRFENARKARAAGDLGVAAGAWRGGLAALEQGLATLPEEHRAARLASAEVRRAFQVGHYDLACCLALVAGSAAGPEAARLREEAFAALRQARAAGFADLGHLEADEDLATLKADPQWQELIRPVQPNER